MLADKKSNKDIVEQRSLNLLTRLKNTYIVVSKKEIRSWQGFIALGFFSGFAAALLFSVSQDLLEKIFAEDALVITNQASVSYQGTDLASYGPATSNTVTIPITQVAPPESPTIDTTPPSAISDLSIIQQDATTLLLVFTATGDDGGIGKADRYDIRYASSPITSENFSTGTELQNAPKPQDAGVREQIVLQLVFPKAQSQNLSQISILVLPNTTYNFAVVATDENNNASGISNVARISIGDAPQPQGDTAPPNKITDLSVSEITTSSLKLAWTSPGDDYSIGTAASYDIRYAIAEIVDMASWNAAIQVQDEPAPSTAGATDSYTLSKLEPQTTYWIAIQAVDDAQIVSEFSNVIRIFTTDGSQPTIQKMVTEIPITIDTEGNYKKYFEANRLKIYNSVTKNLILELQGSSDLEGRITFTPNNLTEGIYDLVVKVPRSLTKLVPAVDFSITSPSSISVRDIVVGNLLDGDDVINSLDFAVLSGKWGTKDSDSDFNQDGAVNSLDWGVMNKNWGKQGDEALQFPTTH